jgi:predicted molibdopterin-dependent oxidoreductase YjgC
MTINSREKGRRAEVALCKLLTAELGVKVERNRDQAYTGGADCLLLPGYAIEIKRREILAKPAWWRQTVAQADKVQQEPLCFYKQNRKPWRALVASNGTYRDVDWTEAMDAIRDKWARLYGVYSERKAA